MRERGADPGVTLAGVLLDEVALMPRSFVEQACARCSVTGAKFWFSCNPAGPGHWFYREWICKAQARNLLHLRFFMEDNPTLSQETRQRYERTFQGAFTGGLCWGSGLRRKGWSMTSLRRAWCGRHRRNQRTGG
ncbi:MAG: hypothetical protein ACLSCQ_15525 [Evtepia gabavorous]